MHPAASSLLTADTALLFVLDIGPLETDAGGDAFREFIEWRAEHPAASLGACMEWVLDSFEVRYTEDLATERVIAEHIAADADGELDSITR